jgi:hypothetical protein
MEREIEGLKGMHYKQNIQGEKKNSWKDGREQRNIG